MLGQKRRVAAVVITVLALFAVAFIIVNPLKSVSTTDLSTVKPVSIKASAFVPVDANPQLVKKRARLIVVEGFHATLLDNDRNLHIYLPPSYYKNPAEKFPVLYVQDGKTVFDISDWSKESLSMHLTTDSLIAQNKIREVIIIGIDNIGAKRLNEYAHWDGIDMGKPILGQGLLYEDFVVNEVKPFVDKNFRTLPDRENTALMGASIGGFATFNIGYRHADQFSKLAMLSPYLGWGNNRLFKELSEGEYLENRPLKMWIDVGSKEGGFVDMAAQGVATLMSKGYKYFDDLVAYEVPEGEHSERFWAQRVEPVLLYFYGDIGKPASVTLYADKQVSKADPQIKHINPVVTYTSGFKLTDVFGGYQVDNPTLLKIGDYGTLFPLREGPTKVNFKSSLGLTAEGSITVVP